MTRWAWIGIVFLVLAGCESKSTAQNTTPATASAPPPRPTPSEAPAPPSAADVRLLEHVEFVTGGADGDDALPIIVALHGLGDKPQTFAGVFQGFSERARVLIPRAPTPYLDGYSWYPFKDNREATAEGIREAAARVTRWLAAIASIRPSRGRPIITGFSQGGALSFAIGAHHPEAAAAVVPVSGYLPRALWPASSLEQIRRPRIVALHGTDDARIAIEPTREAVAHLAAVGLSVELKEFEGVGHSVPPAVKKELHELLAAACAREAQR